MENLRPKDGHVIEIDSGVVGYEIIGELIGVEFEDPSPFIRVKDWPIVIIGGDVDIEGDVSSKELAYGLKGFTGAYSGKLGEASRDSGHWVVVLGNLTVNGNLEVVQNFDLLVSGTVNVHSYRSHSGNFVSPSHFSARDIILTEANEEGGIFQPRTASAKARFCTNWYFDDDVELTSGEDIDADELNGVDVERTRCAVFKVLDRPQEDSSLWYPLTECIQGGLLEAFWDAYNKDERFKPEGVPEHARFDGGWYQLKETNEAGVRHGLEGRWELDGTIVFLRRYVNGEPHGDWRTQETQNKSDYREQQFDKGELVFDSAPDQTVSATSKLLRLLSLLKRKRG